MSQFGQIPRSYKRSLSMNASHLLLVLLYWHGVIAETNSPKTSDAGTRLKAIVHKGQSDVVVEKLEILKPQNIVLLCNLTDIPSKPSNITGYWTKDGNETENSRQTINRRNEQYSLQKIFNIQGSNLGNYSCIFSSSEKNYKATFVLKAPAFKDKKERPIVSYVGDSVVLDCGIKQTPKTWEWYKVNGTEKVHINATADPTNYNISRSENITKLTVLNLSEEDSGKYICSAVFDIKPIDSHLELKVLSFTEPLKPFVAIAIEVVILVTLILLYERHSNKRKGPIGTTDNGLYEHTPTQDENATDNGATTARQRRMEH